MAVGRARFERRPEQQRGLKNYDSGLRNGSGRHLHTGEGEVEIQIPQARHTTVPFVSKLFPKWHCKRLFRTDPLKTLVICGLSEARGSWRQPGDRAGRCCCHAEATATTARISGERRR